MTQVIIMENSMESKLTISVTQSSLQWGYIIGLNEMDRKQKDMEARVIYGLHGELC